MNCFNVVCLSIVHMVTACFLNEDGNKYYDAGHVFPRSENFECCRGATRGHSNHTTTHYYFMVFALGPFHNIPLD